MRNSHYIHSSLLSNASKLVIASFAILLGSALVRPPNTFRGPVTLVAGTQPFTCLNTSDMATIGNAAGVLTQMDPKDGTKLWTTQQWGGDAERCAWTTRIVAYQIDSGEPKVKGGR